MSGSGISLFTFQGVEHGDSDRVDYASRVSYRTGCAVSRFGPPPPSGTGHQGQANSGPSCTSIIRLEPVWPLALHNRTIFHKTASSSRGRDTEPAATPAPGRSHAVPTPAQQRQPLSAVIPRTQPGTNSKAGRWRSAGRRPWSRAGTKQPAGRPRVRDHHTTSGSLASSFIPRAGGDVSDSVP